MTKGRAIGAGVFAAIALAYFLFPSRGEPGTGFSADRECRKLLAEKQSQEALSWLEQSKPGDIRTIGEQGPGDSLKIVRNLYSSGALKAQVVDVDRVEGVGESSNIVCVELPDARSERNKLFRIESDIASRGGFDGVPDEGQSYLFLHKFGLTWAQSFGIFLHL